MFVRLKSVTCHQRHACISLVRPLLLLICFLVLARPWPFACQSWHVACIPSQFYSSLTSRLLSLTCLCHRSFLLVAPDMFASSFLVVCRPWHFRISLASLFQTLKYTEPWRIACHPLHVCVSIIYGLCHFCTFLPVLKNLLSMGSALRSRSPDILPVDSDMKICHNTSHWHFM